MQKGQSGIKIGVDHHTLGDEDPQAQVQKGQSRTKISRTKIGEGGPSDFG